ncbi:hypothetical protein WMF04_01180 [Sorangium sp. So ce260]|uniref:hypothetical protein n=1 Tax=Sorangium sp. So ce260 TaxID=3133291 RepID=UPI003F63BD4A
MISAFATFCLFVTAQPALAAGSYLITDGVTIQRSIGTDGLRIFHRWTLQAHLGPGERAFISSDPAGTGPIIVDDGVLVNGHEYVGFTRTLNNPMRHLGESAAVSFSAVEPIEVTRDARQDGVWHIELVDYVYTFAAGRLYLVIK